MRQNTVQITRNTDNKIEPVETAEKINLTPEAIRLFDSLASVLEYPVEGHRPRLKESLALCFDYSEPAGGHFGEFFDSYIQLNLNEAQELYTRTFDLKPVCALEIGYHLFGEDYKRGAFLAQLRETENPYKLGQERQLPDYLPVVLRLLGQMKEADLRASLIGCCLLPALSKMNGHLKKKKNLYENLFSCLESVLNDIASDSILKSEILSARYQHV